MCNKCDNCYWSDRCWLNSVEDEELTNILIEVYKESGLDWFTFITQDIGVLESEIIKRCEDYTPLVNTSSENIYKFTSRIKNFNTILKSRFDDVVAEVDE